MNIAAIDIGTNTCLLLIARVDDQGMLFPIIDEQRLPRLGKGVDADRILSQDSMMRVVSVLREYRQHIEKHRPDSISVAATSAVRDAVNRSDFIDLVRTETGFELEVLRGDEEALWTYRGAISGVKTTDAATVIDIGGGSTEITVGEGLQVLSSMSLDIGSVRIAERFLHHDPPVDKELEEARTFIIEHLSRYPLPGQNSRAIGVAGTAVALALLDLGIQEFTTGGVSNYRLGRDRVSGLLHRLRQTTASEIRSFSPFLVGREDIITAGALILDTLLLHYDFSSITVSERGLRHGLTLRAWSAESGTLSPLPPPGR